MEGGIIKKRRKKKSKERKDVDDDEQFLEQAMKDAGEERSALLARGASSLSRLREVALGNGLRCPEEHALEFVSAGDAGAGCLCWVCRRITRVGDPVGVCRQCMDQGDRQVYCSACVMNFGGYGDPAVASAG